jgi:hypothetical protein
LSNFKGYYVEKISHVAKLSPAFDNELDSDSAACEVRENPEYYRGSDNVCLDNIWKCG